MSFYSFFFYPKQLKLKRINLFLKAPLTFKTYRRQNCEKNKKYLYTIILTYYYIYIYKNIQNIIINNII